MSKFKIGDKVRRKQEWQDAGLWNNGDEICEVSFHSDMTDSIGLKGIDTTWFEGRFDLVRSYVVEPSHEDDIYRVKNFVGELSKIQDQYLKELSAKMNLTERGDDFLFDYVMNDYKDCEDFEHYLEKFNLKGNIYENSNI